MNLTDYFIQLFILNVITFAVLGLFVVGILKLTSAIEYWIARRRQARHVKAWGLLRRFYK